MRVLILGEGSVGQALGDVLKNSGVEVVDAAELDATPASPQILEVSWYSAKDLAGAIEVCRSSSIEDWDYPDKIFDYLPMSVIMQVLLFASAPRQARAPGNYKRVLWVYIGL